MSQQQTGRFLLVGVTLQIPREAEARTSAVKAGCGCVWRGERWALGGPQLHSPGMRSQACGVNRRATPRPEVLPWRTRLAGTSVCERSRVTWEQPPGPPSALVTALQVPLARTTVWLTHLLKRPAFLHLVPALDLLRICSLPSSGREENPRGCWPPPGSSADCQHSGFSYGSCSQLPRKGW